MALSKPQLKDRIIVELEAQGFSTSTNGRDEGGWMPKFAQALANAVVDEIQANARATGSDSDNDSHDLMVV